MNTSEVLNTAADLIEERGWGQGAASWGDQEGSNLCLEGGIIAATGGARDESGRHTACPAYRAVSDYLTEEQLTLQANDYCELVKMSAKGDDSPRLWKWNDAPNRTQAEVIETLRACALIEAAKERAASDEHAAESAVGSEYSGGAR